MQAVTIQQVEPERIAVRLNERFADSINDAIKHFIIEQELCSVSIELDACILELGRLCGMSALPPQWRHDVCGRIDDAVDLRGELLEGVQHFVFKAVPVVNGADAAE